MNSTEFVNLFNSIYTRKINSAYYYWRFGRQDSNSRIFFAHDEQGLKGCVGLHLLDMGGFTAALVVDAMINERCRGDGRTFVFLSAKINKCAKANDVKALFMLPNERGTHAWSGDRGWHVLTTIPTYARDTCPHPRPTRITASFPKQFDTWADTIKTTFERGCPGKFAIVARKKSYLNWRFENPMHDYTIIRVHQPKEHAPFGYIVLKTFTDPKTKQPVGDIVDMLWTEGNPDTLVDMLYTALDYFYRQGISKAMTWLHTSTVLDSRGYYLGFTPTQQRRHFCVKILDSDYAWLYDPGHWYLTMADSEVY